MGADPGEAYVALGAADGLRRAERVVELVRGMEALAARTGTTIAGGDVVRAPALTIDGRPSSAGPTTRRSSSAATARGPATSSA